MRTRIMAILAMTLAAVIASSAGGNDAPGRYRKVRPDLDAAAKSILNIMLSDTPTARLRIPFPLPRQGVEVERAIPNAPREKPEPNAGLKTIVIGLAMSCAIALAGIQLVRRRGGSRTATVWMLK